MWMEAVPRMDSKFSNPLSALHFTSWRLDLRLLHRPHLQFPRLESVGRFRSSQTVIVESFGGKGRAFDGGRLRSGRCCGFRTVVGADLDAVAPGLSRPGGVVESDKLPGDVRKRAMDAVDACGGRVTIGDVASRAGLKLEAQKALQALAADTERFLEVSDEGDVLYVFSKDY